MLVSEISARQVMHIVAEPKISVGVVPPRSDVLNVHLVLLLQFAAVTRSKKVLALSLILSVSSLGRGLL